MAGKWRNSITARRLFLTRLGAAAGVLGAAVTDSSAAMAQTTEIGPWRPARHTQDDWLEKIAGEHRFLFDTTTGDGMALAVQFAGNYFTANAEAYGLKESDLAIVIVARHKSTPFGYNDVMWAKYGKQFSEHAEFMDPATKKPPNINVYTTNGVTPNQGGRLDILMKKGVHIAVCQTSSRGIAAKIAKATGVAADGVINEMAANLITNARLVPAGILIVNRAQERGYSFVHAI